MLARFFIDRPIFAWVISIGIVLLGFFSGWSLPVAQYPDITPPTVRVSCVYPGANANVVADSVAAPIEQQVNGVEGMAYMSSQCTNDGTYALTVTFNLGTDLDMAQVLVQNRVSLAMPLLPPQVQLQGVNVKKQSPNFLMVVNLISPNGRYDDLYLSNFATIQIKDELLRIPGVGDIAYLGQRDYSMRIWLDPEKMAHRQLTTVDVVSAIQKQNEQVAAGNIGQPPVPAGQQFQFPMSTLGRLGQESEFADIILKIGQGSDDQGRVSSQVVRLSDVSRVEMGAQQYDQLAGLDGLPTVGLAIFQLPGSNALQVAEEIKARMEELKSNFPTGLEYRIVYDTTPFINQSVWEVLVALLDAVILVAIVVLLFLQDWKAVILPMIDVPVSLVGTAAVMAGVSLFGNAVGVSALQFSLNNLTLLAMVLAIGIVVDDAIVVLENIERLIATGLDVRTATIKAMDEITGVILAITLVLCAVFLPAAFMPGIPGQFFRQFALVISSAMVISAINAMTLTPARAVTIFKIGHGGEHEREALPWWIFALIAAGLAYVFGLVDFGRWLIGSIFPEDLANLPAARRPVFVALFGVVIILGGVIGKLIIKPVNRVLGRFFLAFNRLFDKATVVYGRGIARLLRVSTFTLLLYGGLLLLTWWTMAKAPTGFLPVQDQGYLLVNVQLPDSASVQRTQEVINRIQRIALGDDTGKYHGPPATPGDKRYPGVPGIAHTVSVAGMSFLMGANGSNFGSTFLVLDPFDKRKGHELYDEEIAARVSALFSEEIDDAVVSVFRAPPIQGLGNAGGFQFQVEQRGYVDLHALQQTTDDLLAVANEDPRFAGVFTLFRAETPQIYIKPDRVKCESLMVDVADVNNTLQVYMGGYFVNLFNKFGRTWQVIVMADARYRTKPELVSQLKVRNKLGQMVPLGTVVDIQNAGGPVLVMRYNMYASAAAFGSYAPGTSSGQAIQIIDDLARRQNATIEWTGMTEFERRAGNVVLLVFGLGTVLVYLVLAAKYESWSLPASVILVVPLCLLCAVGGMWILTMPVDIFVQVGLLVLVGMAAKNAVLIVEFAEQLRKEGKSMHEAILDACRLRLRPILMTSFAFIGGVIPLMLGHGAGAEMRVSLGTAVFYGMVGVTFFGIFLTPIFYHVIMKREVQEDKPAPAKMVTPLGDGHIQPA